MILKLCLYNNYDEIGKKFLVMDNIADLRAVYDKVNVVPIKDGGLVFESTENANDVIHDNYEVERPKKFTFLKLEFRQKTSGFYTDFIFYTDNEVYVCNDDGQTIEKFRKL